MEKITLTIGILAAIYAIIALPICVFSLYRYQKAVGLANAIGITFVGFLRVIAASIAAFIMI